MNIRATETQTPEQTENTNYLQRRFLDLEREWLLDLDLEQDLDLDLDLDRGRDGELRAFDMSALTSAPLLKDIGESSGHAAAEESQEPKVDSLNKH